MSWARRTQSHYLQARFALAFVCGDLDDGAACIDRALALNPNLAAAWSVSGRIRIYLGEHQLAFEHLVHSMRLSPRDSLMFLAQNGIAFVHLFAGHYDEASLWAEKALREHPNYYPALRVLAASNALAGRLEEAQKTMARLRAVHPTLRVSDLRGLPPLRRPEDFATYSEGLRKAGLPE